MDPPTQLFRVDENKYNDFYQIVSFIFPEKFMSGHKGFSIYNESGSKYVLKLPWFKHFTDYCIYSPGSRIFGSEKSCESEGSDS